MYAKSEELLRPNEESNIQQPEFSQPICTAIQIGLVNLLKGWGIRPAAVVGHSSGEIGAAYATGSLTLEMAIAIAYYRGQVTQQHGRIGGMAAVGLGRVDATSYLQQGVVIACENSPKSVTLSGDVEKLDEVIAKIKEDIPDCFARKLRVERAYHSHHMKDIGEMYEKLLTGIVKDSRPSVPFFSTVMAKQIKRAGHLGPAYWRENLENPVLFYPAVQLMMYAATKDTIFLEVGPHAALAGPLRDVFKSVNVPTTSTYVGTLIRGESGVKSMLSSLGRLFQEAVAVDLAATTTGRTVLTDLPNYAWQHENAYWYESRVSREWRLRKFPPHELLGNRLMESDDLEPAWRNMFRLDDVPWARDHKIQEDIVLPAAAYIAMAIEAVRQLNGGGKTDASLKQVDIQNALVLREQQAHEIVTHLRPVRLTSKLDSVWYEFSISSFTGTTWVKHCTGRVRPGKEISAGLEDVGEQPRLVSTAGWYRIMKKVGLNYGPEFQGMSDISAYPGQNKGAATIKNRDPSLGPYYTMHPNVLDLVLQSFTVAMADGLTRQLNKLCVPTYIDELYINNSDESSMRLGASAVSSITGVAKGSATIMSGDKLVLSLKGGEFSPLESGDDEVGPMPAAHLHWRPDVDFIAPVNLIQAKRSSGVDLAKLERFSLMCQLEILHQVADIEPASESIAKFRDWLVEQRTNAANGQYDHVKDSAKLAALSQKALAIEIESVRDEVFDMIECSSISKLLSRIASNAEGIFRGDQDAATILEQDGGLRQVLKYISAQCDYKPFLELLGHSNPTMKVLEIGAGAAGLTLDILRGLTNKAGERTYSQYVYSDMTNYTFESAKEALKGHENIEFKIFNVSKDPLAQDFDVESFDLIIAPNAIHTAPSIKEALSHVRKLLKPSGRLILQELSPSLQMFGFLIRFYLTSAVCAGDGVYDANAKSLYLSASEWNSELLAAGFSGNEAVVLDGSDFCHINVNIVSNAVAPVTQPRGKITILGRPMCKAATELHDLLIELGFDVVFSTLLDIPCPHADVISLLDLEDTMFFQMTESTFKSWQRYLTRFPPNRGMLWVTGHAQVGSEDPRFATSIGATRNIRSELSLDFATLEMDLSAFEAEAVASVYEKFRNRVKTDEFDPEWEYAILDSTVMIPRYQWIDIDQHAATDNTEAGVPRKLEISRMGQLQALQWAEDTAAALQDDEVEITPRAVGLNFKVSSAIYLAVAAVLLISVIKILGRPCRHGYRRRLQARPGH